MTTSDIITFSAGYEDDAKIQLEKLDIDATSIVSPWHHNNQIYFIANNELFGFYAPLIYSLIPTVGSSPTFSRTTTASVVDFEGVVNTAKIEESRFEGARRVENLLDFSEDFSNAVWIKGGTASVTGTNVVNFPAENDAINAEGVSVLIGNTIYGSIVLSGSGNISFLFNGPIEGTKGEIVVNLTATPTRYCITHTNINNEPDMKLFLKRRPGQTDQVIAIDAQFEISKGSQSDCSEYVSSDVSNTSELIKNGGFDTSDYWNTNTGWNISGGTANANQPLVNAFLEQEVDVKNFVKYMIQYDIANYIAGSIRTLFYGDLQVGIGDIKSANGTYSQVVEVSTSTGTVFTGLRFQSVDDDFIGSIDNVSIKRIEYHGANVDGVKYFGTDRSGNPIADETLKGYLSEEQRTNLVLRSEDFSTGWNMTGTSVSTDEIDSPDGSKTADKIEATVTGTAAVFQNDPVTSGNVYTQSVMAKAGNTDFLLLTFGTGGFGTSQYAIFNLANGTIDTEQVGHAEIKPLYDGWFRCSFTVTATSTQADTGVIIMTPSRTGASRTQGVLGDYIYVWGAQAEEDSFPTSYIKTEATSITRTADALSYGAEDIKQGEGSIVAEFNQLGVDGTFPAVISLSDGTSNNRILLQAIASNVAKWVITDSGVTQTSISSPIDSFNYNEPVKTGIAYKTDDVKAYLDGNLEGSDNLSTIPINLNLIGIGINELNNVNINGNVKNVKIHNEKLTDDQMESLTQ